MSFSSTGISWGLEIPRAAFRAFPRIKSLVHHHVSDMTFEKLERLARASLQLRFLDLTGAIWYNLIPGRGRWRGDLIAALDFFAQLEEANLGVLPLFPCEDSTMEPVISWATAHAVKLIWSRAA